MDLGLKNRIALVAAASQGLGHATAMQLAREGALVAICGRDATSIAAAADAIHVETGQSALGVQADVTRPDQVEMLVERCVEEFGGIDILITNAGGPPAGSFDSLDDEAWLKAFNLTVMSAVRLIRAALPQLRQSTAPSVLSITSISAKQPIQNLTLSNSLRLAVIGLTKTLALELGGENIRFNSVLPGWTTTERVYDLLNVRAARNSSSLEEELARQAEQSPFKRLATPEEFARVAAFLVSPAASYLSGAMIPVDGGSYVGTF